MNSPGIAAIASYIPKGRINNFELAATFGKNREFVSNRIGAHTLPVIGDDQKTSDLAVPALEELFRKTGFNREKLDCLILCTQNPDGRGLPHTAAVIQKKARLPMSTAAFDLSLGCSGYVYGLKVLKGFLQETGLNTGVLITADPYSKIIDKEDGDTRMLFGDGATATLLSRQSPVLRIGNALFATDGNGAQYLQNVDGRLTMNGRQVFNFAATRVPEQIMNLLELNNLTLADIDRVILHQGSRYIVETLGQRLDLPAEKLVQDIEQTGNTISSSIPLLLERYIHEPQVKTILLSGFGVGFSWGTLLLNRVEGNEL
jgi:3-oxoacyl-[acyl-carrier-protein] synthase-3